MKKNTQKIKCDTFYHIYNRGINGETIFKQERNYHYFLNQYAKYILPIADTYAFCLMSNHFHFLIKIKSENEVFENLKPDITKQKGAEFYVTNQFAKLFNSYAQAINKSFGRTGPLFEEPFRRIEVSNGSYFKSLVTYIHLNPQLHGFVDDYKDYYFSSYHSFIKSGSSKLQKDQVLNWFGDVKQYEDYHRLFYSESLKLKAIQEF
jgi:REP element-mobilizing transposase RayT